MKKFVNHVDHVTWISSLANLEANVARLEAITDGSLLRFERPDMGFVMYLDWDAGLEVVAPMDESGAFGLGGCAGRLSMPRAGAVSC